MTNEEYIKAIDMRRSRRSYKNKPLDPQIMDVIKEMVDAVNEIADLDLLRMQHRRLSFSAANFQ